jgi:hypothetical protein
MLLDEVKVAHNVQDVMCTLDPTIKGHGAFDPDSKSPAILINPISGLNASNVAHTLIHALQVAEGYPTIPRGIFSDRRQDVVAALRNSVLDVALVQGLAARDFSPNEYFEPTVRKIEEVLSARATPNNLSILRVHYEAAIYIRLEYEGAYLPPERRADLDELFLTKSPVGFRLGKGMLKIIKRSAPYSARGNAITLVKLLKFLNTTTIGKEIHGFRVGLYTSCINAITEKYLN